MIYKKRVSIIVATYNSEKYIDDCIRSILSQTYKFWELIIIDDASTDSTLKKISQYKNKKIIIIKLKKNIGSYKAINFAINLCKGKYIAILDSDDISHPSRLQKQVDLLDSEEKIGLVATWYKIIDAKNKILESIKMPGNKNFNLKFPCNNFICHSSVMFKKKIAIEFGLYDDKLVYASDYNLFLKIFTKYKIKFIKEFLVYYRRHDKQKTQTKSLKESILKEILINLRFSKKNKLININNFYFYLKNYIFSILKLILLKTYK